MLRLPYLFSTRHGSANKNMMKLDHIQSTNAFNCVILYKDIKPILITSYFSPKNSFSWQNAKLTEAVYFLIFFNYKTFIIFIIYIYSLRITIILSFSTDRYQHLHHINVMWYSIHLYIT